MRIVVVLGLLVPCAALARAQDASTTLPGSKHLNDSKLAPREWEVVATLKRSGQEIVGGTTRHSLVSLPGNRWAYITVTTSQLGIATDTTIAMRESLAPVSHRSHTVPRVMELDYNGKRVTGSYTPKDSASRHIDRATDVPTFDAAMLDVILGALPLSANYQTRLPMYIEERGGLVWFDVRVDGQTTVGATTGWNVRVDVTGYNVLFVLATDDHRVLSGRVEYPNGAVMHMTVN